MKTALDDTDEFIRFRAMLGLSKIAGRASEGGIWAAKAKEIKADEGRFLQHWKEWAEFSPDDE